MEKKQKGFGSYFGKCFGIILLIAFLTFLAITVLNMFFKMNGNDTPSIFYAIQFYVPSIAIIASVPVSLIYAAIKTGK